MQLHVIEGVRDTGEINDQPSKVEKIGYRSSKDRIEDLITAGYRLQLSRSEQFDFPDGVESELYLPHREPDFDLADASAIQRDLKARLNARKQALRASENVLESPPIDNKTEKLPEMA